MSRGWIKVGLVTWLATLLAFVAVAISSRTVGKAAWWIGPSTNTAPFVFLLVPVALIMTPIVTMFYAPERIVRIGSISALFLAGIGLIDIGRSPGVAIIEMVIAASALIGSVAMRAGASTV
jgi:hypothetical protein